MDEARNLTYSINVETNAAQAESDLRNLVGGLGNAGRIEINADTAQAESNIRRITGDLGSLETDAGSIGKAFRSSFLGHRWRQQLFILSKIRCGWCFLLRR